MGVQEIVRIVKESKPDAKHRRFHLQWYNEYGGEVSDKWESEGGPFSSTEASYGELLLALKRRNSDIPDMTCANQAQTVIYHAGNTTDIES